MSEADDSGIPRPPFGIEPGRRRRRDELDGLLHPDPSLPRTFEAGIATVDGVELAATVHLPRSAELPVPAIVRGTPYNKDWAVGDEDAERVAAGYAVVVFDCRGRGKSEGVWHPFTLTDGDDGATVVEWVAAQEWCTGAVGVEGLSYDGWVAMATVSRQPPHLKAAVPFSPAGRWQEEIPYLHGCLQTNLVWWWTLVRRRIMDESQTIDVRSLLQLLPISAMGEIVDAAGPGWREMMEHDTLDDLWRARRWDGEYDFDVPCLYITGWYDREDIHGTFHHYEQMTATSPARDRQWLLVGPWSHTSTAWSTDVYDGIEAPGSALDTQAVMLRFFDRFLKGADNGVDREPRVQLYDPGDGSWKIRECWQGDTSERKVFLAADSRLLDSPGSAGETTYRYDPMTPNGQRFDVVEIPWEPPLDLGELEAQPGVVSWTGEALDADLTVRGWGALDLWAASDCEDTDWHVKLADVDPDGRASCVAWGCLRASYGADPSDPQPLVPGEASRFSIELTPAFHTFKAGHRLRVVLASSEFPWFARNLNSFGPIVEQAEARTASNTVLHGSAHPSSLRLTVET
jgi:uncharacterized protein